MSALIITFILSACPLKNLFEFYKTFLATEFVKKTNTQKKQTFRHVMIPLSFWMCYFEFKFSNTCFFLLFLSTDLENRERKKKLSFAKSA